VDESGKFDDEQDCAVVGGLLVSAEASAARPEALRLALQQAVPGFPWPLHAKLLNQASYVALASYLAAGGTGRAADEPQPADSSEDDRARHVAARMAEWDPAGVTACLDDLRTCREPLYSLLRKLTNRLRMELPRDYLWLDDRIHEAWARVGDLARSLADPGREHEGRPGILLVTAAETEVGDACQGTGQSAEDCRYFALFESLLGRVARVLDRLGGRHVVELHVANRGLFEPVLGVVAKLHIRHLVQPAERAGESVAGRVRLIPAVAACFDESVEGGLVLADFLVNYARRKLRHERNPLEAIEGRLAARFGLPVTSGEPRASHLAATGVAAAFLESTRDPVVGQVQAPSWSGRRRRWACEQARQWAEVGHR
jgi:hypothetical protein